MGSLASTPSLQRRHARGLKRAGGGGGAVEEVPGGRRCGGGAVAVAEEASQDDRQGTARAVLREGPGTAGTYIHINNPILLGRAWDPRGLPKTRLATSLCSPFCALGSGAFFLFFSSILGFECCCVVLGWGGAEPQMQDESPL